MRHLVLSDAHGDFHALDNAIICAKDSDYHDIWYLGDAIGYCSTKDAIKCYDWLKNNNAISILGNWEWWILTPDLDPSNSSTNHNSANNHSDKTRYQRLNDIVGYRKELPSDYFEFIHTWPEQIVFMEKGVTIFHGNPYIDKTLGIIHSSTNYLEEARDNDKIYEEGIIQTTYLFVGHSHIPGYIPWVGVMNPFSLERIPESKMPISLKKPRPGNHRTILIGAVGKEARSGYPPCAIVFDDESLSIDFIIVR